jgi:hypothetical protein
MRQADLNLQHIFILVMVAAAAGVTGHTVQRALPLAGWPFLLTPPGHANLTPAQPAPASDSKATNRDPRLPAAQTASRGDAAPARQTAAPPTGFISARFRARSA